MDAKELREWIAREPRIVCDAGRNTILHALDLLAAVEASADETVRELGKAIEISGGPTGGGAGHYLNKMADIARAKLTAQSQEIAQLKAERGSLKQQLRDWANEALEDVDSWAGYASEYFQEKHDLRGDLGKWKVRAAHPETKP